MRILDWGCGVRKLSIRGLVDVLMVRFNSDLYFLSEKQAAAETIMGDLA